MLFRKLTLEDNCPEDFNPGQEDCDQDGEGFACDEQDLPPYDPTVFPGAEELCNGKDDNCSGQVDEWYPDTDGDGLADCVDPDDDNDGDEDISDCAPLDSAIHHGAQELCNGVDDDCNTEVDDEPVFEDAACPPVGVCLNMTPICSGGEVVCEKGQAFYWCFVDYCDELDNDCDGEIDEDCGQDCEPLNPSIHPCAEELCDGIDNNCNGVVDDELAVGCSDYYLDSDGDLWGVEEDKKCLCSPTEPYSTWNTGDCNDGDPAVNPGASELCNLADEDCDGEIDEDADLDCDDGNPCTDDSCEPGVGCIHAANEADCDDGNACTTGDHCEEGACVFDGPTICNDGDFCSDDSCDPAQGCVFTLNEAPCDDGDICTLADHCHLGDCISSTQLTCHDGNVCTDDVCDPTAGCQFAPNDAACDDANACTTGDHCSFGTCAAVGTIVCNDDNPCTDDLCDPETGCASVPNANTCSDGDACTVDDVCADGVCTGGEALDCDDGNVCTDDVCDDGLGCVFVPSEAGCGDGWTCCGGDCVEGLCCSEIPCPLLEGYDVMCNAKDHCEYTDKFQGGWTPWDVWLYVPPGTFQMGSEEGEDTTGNSEQPVHTVTLNYGYMFSKYEIVVEQYEACVSAGACSPPSTAAWDAYGWGTNSSGNGRSDHPQNGISWQQAQDFCAWAAPGGRLPSEAEWEYAATGPVHMKYPWGDTPTPSCTNNTAVFMELGGEPGEYYGCYQGGTWPVGSKTSGASWSGALDMSGNLSEWVEDCWHDSYVGAPVDGSAWTTNCSPTARIKRGGGFNGSWQTIRSASRGLYAGWTVQVAQGGARCLRPL